MFSLAEQVEPLIIFTNIKLYTSEHIYVCVRVVFNICMHVCMYLVLESKNTSLDQNCLYFTEHCFWHLITRTKVILLPIDNDDTFS